MDYGALFCATLLILVTILPNRLRSKITNWASMLSKNTFTYLFLFFALLSLLYLFYPNYFDHFESSVGNFGQILHQKRPLYPMDGNFPYNGSVYGPVTAEIQYLVQSFQIPIMLASKLPGIIAFFSFGIVIRCLSRKNLDFAYLIFIFSGGYMLFWNRADPWLLLLVSLTLLVGIQKKWQARRYILFGVLGAFASGLKIHGIIYVICAILASGSTSIISSRLILHFVTAFAATYSLLFLPKSISFTGAMHYLYTLGPQGHDLSATIFLHNFLTLTLLISPIAIQIFNNRQQFVFNWSLTALLVCELLLCIVASRPGAGIHHLLPLIPINSFVLRSVRNTSISIDRIFDLIVVSMVFVSIVTSYVVVRPALQNWKTYANSASELDTMQEIYPKLLMGVSDMDSYSFTYQKVNLLDDVRQIDYSSFMDMQGSGIKDAEFGQELKNCRYKFIVMPLQGKPFSLRSYEYRTNLFTQETRKIFKDNYNKLISGKYYRVYECAKNTPKGSIAP